MTVPYQLYTPRGSNTPHVKKTDDDGTITTFKANGQNHFALEYQEWLAEGNTPEPNDPEPVPEK